MHKSVFFRRVLLLLILALLLWALLTALIYNVVSRPIFTRIKVNELQPKAESIAAMASRTFMQSDPFFNELIESSTEFLDVWIFVVDGLSGEFRNSVMPDDALDAEQEIRHLIVSHMDPLLSGQYTSLWFTSRLRNASTGEMLFIGVPVYTRFGVRSTIIGAVFFVHPMKELNAGFSSMNIALLASSLLVFLIMIIPAYLATARLTRPLRQTRDVALAMAAGDFSVRAEVKQKDEIGELAMTMNNLAENLSKTISDLVLERNRLKQILEGMSDGLIAVDQAGHYTQANPAAWSLLGLENKPDHPVDPLTCYPQLAEIFQKAIQTGKRLVEQLSVAGRIIRVQAAPLTDEKEQIVGAVALLHDITESERLEQTRRDYVANVSHELRSPLTAMRALIEPLSDGMVPDEADRQRYYHILLREIIRLSHLIDDMLELSRLQAGTLPIQEKIFDLSVMLRDLAIKYGPQAEEEGLLLILPDHLEDCPLVVGDPERVEQVMVILIDNALKFTPEGGQITLSVDWDDESVRVHVRDNGIGIAPNDISHVFDRFYKADKAHQQPGTGLGLSIAKEILQRMGQTISVQSKEGEGTVFTFTLKRADQNKKETTTSDLIPGAVSKDEIAARAKLT
ncbi:MAG: HAMP domain-containing protein [Clostridia bacterium]|nr:HAMP domain-containing protein [Clostridia bacterium]